MAHANFDTFKLTIDGKDPDFSLAKHLGEVLAADILSDPMLITWYYSNKGRRASTGS